MTDGFIDRIEAAEILKVNPRTLDAWRLRGEGPPYYKVGRMVRYRRDEVIQYVEKGRTENT